jgi:hypothetical protein
VPVYVRGHHRAAVFTLSRPPGDAPSRRRPAHHRRRVGCQSTGTVSAFTIGDRVFHQKFGNGNVVNIDGNKLTIQFDKAGEKRVVDRGIGLKLPGKRVLAC